MLIKLITIDSNHFIRYKCRIMHCLGSQTLPEYKWLQLNLNPEILSSWTNTQPFGQTGQVIELCSEYLSARCIWLYVLVMSRKRFRVNTHSIVAWMSRNSLPKQARNLTFKWLQLDIKTNIEYGFTLKRLRGMTRTSSHYLSIYQRLLLTMKNFRSMKC